MYLKKVDYKSLEITVLAETDDVAKRAINLWVSSALKRVDTGTKATTILHHNIDLKRTYGHGCLYLYYYHYNLYMYDLCMFIRYLVPITQVLKDT
jgi:hypothetical protein